MKTVKKRFSERLGVRGFVDVMGIKTPSEVLLNSKGMPTLADVTAPHEVVFSHRFRNLVVDAGRAKINAMMANESALLYIKSLSIGTGGYEPGPQDVNIDPAPPNPLDIALTASYFSKDWTTKTPPNVLATTFALTLQPAEGNGNISEFGCFLSDGTMFARVTRRPIPKTNDMYLVVRWTFQF